MARVNRLMERRALRRAADQALLTSLGAPADQVGGPADRDFVYTDVEREHSEPDPAPAYDHDPDTAPIPVGRGRESVLPHSVPPWEQVPAARADLYDVVPEPVAEPQWTDVPEDVVAPPVRPLRARPVAETAYVRPELDFAAAGYRERPWYRTKPAAAVLAVAVIAALLCGGWFVLRSPNQAAEQSPVDAPTSAPPAPAQAAPTAAGAPRPKPAPPPPPPPPPASPPPTAAEPTYSAPQRQYQPRYTQPTPAEKPRVDVTRAPMSVAPVPKPVPGSDSNTPGDAPGEKPRRRGCFGFC